LVRGEYGLLGFAQFDDWDFPHGIVGAIPPALGVGENPAQDLSEITAIKSAAVEL
jgi:hypothetical protein